jgi:hypothetical protein
MERNTMERHEGLSFINSKFEGNKSDKNELEISPPLT